MGEQLAASAVTRRLQKPDGAVLLDLLLDWAPDEGSRNRILVTNPAELYRFTYEAVSK